MKRQPGWGLSLKDLGCETSDLGCETSAWLGPSPGWGRRRRFCSNVEPAPTAPAQVTSQGKANEPPTLVHPNCQDHGYEMSIWLAPYVNLVVAFNWTLNPEPRTRNPKPQGTPNLKPQNTAKPGNPKPGTPNFGEPQTSNNPKPWGTPNLQSNPECQI